MKKKAKKTKKDKKILKTIGETAEILGVSYKTIYWGIKKGEIPFYKFGRVYRLNVEEVLEAVRNKQEVKKKRKRKK